MRLMTTIVSTILICGGIAVSAIAESSADKIRLITLTDITNEPDDEQSMIRLLLYANEFDLEGLIATTSVWLHDTVAPEKIVERIRAYGKVRPNLIKHADGYPTEDFPRGECPGSERFSRVRRGRDRRYTQRQDGHSRR